MLYFVDRNVVMWRVTVPERREISSLDEIAMETGLSFVVFKKSGN